jgi:hypothetical protein
MTQNNQNQQPHQQAKQEVQAARANANPNGLRQVQAQESSGQKSSSQ